MKLGETCVGFAGPVWPPTQYRETIYMVISQQSNELYTAILEALELLEPRED